MFHQSRKYADFVPKPPHLFSIFQESQGTHDDEAKSSRSKRSRHKTVKEVLLPQVHHEFLLWEGFNRDAKSRMGCDGEIDDMLRIRLRKARSDEEIFTYRTTGYDKIKKNDLCLLSMFDVRHQNGDLDATTLKDLIDSDGKLIPDDPQSGVPRVGIFRPLRASMQDLYDRMGKMEIRQEAIKRMEYRQSYH
nr:hypothetical protein [Tanacetum cinerariifolium]